jgi:hypothetical protein
MTMQPAIGAELRRAEHVAHLGDTDDFLAHFHAEHAGRDLFHLIDHVIDDREVAQVQAVVLHDARAVASARTLKPMITAFDAAASVASDSVMPPTPLAITLILI